MVSELVMDVKRVLIGLIDGWEEDMVGLGNWVKEYGEGGKVGWVKVYDCGMIEIRIESEVELEEVLKILDKSNKSGRVWLIGYVGNWGRVGLEIGYGVIRRDERGGGMVLFDDVVWYREEKGVMKEFNVKELFGWDKEIEFEKRSM